MGIKHSIAVSKFGKVVLMYLGENTKYMVLLKFFLL